MSDGSTEMPSAADVGLTRLDDFAEVHAPGNHALRLERIRALAPVFKARFKQQGPVLGVRTLPIARAPYPVTFAFNRACTLPYPFLLFQNRAILLRFKQRGVAKTLLFNPTLPERSATAPFFAAAKEKMAPLAFLEKTLVQPQPDLPTQLGRHGLSAGDIDYVAFDHQHVQDIRPYVGADGQPGLFPKAHFLVQRADWEASLHTHPLQRWWWVARSAEGARRDRVVLLDGDFALGDGAALLHTPGHTWGNQTLLFHAPNRGCFTVSENGICADAYSPQHSGIPGLSAHASQTGEEVILNGNTLEGALDQYNSMVLEKLLADPLAADPRFVQHFSSSELVSSVVAPGLSATREIRSVDEGTVTGA